MIKTRILLAFVCFLSWGAISQAAIISVLETGLSADTPAIIAGPFGENALSFSDRTHEHQGAAFDGGGLLSTGGTTIPLPGYLAGNEYVRFANDARENLDYSATVIADEQVNWYLLVDNRLDGPAGNGDSPNTTDPVLGGALSWVTLGNWERVNTGISPNGQGDYTAVDEGGDGTLNQFYSVYKYPLATNVVTVFSDRIGGRNMISLVASPVPEPSSLLLLISAGLLGLVRRRR